ncbi:cytochrome P450 2K6-like isoform X1 [Rhinatrema bivittatum]|uniref:cytochrome P450 2K6-like isoform X1 n=1 Tax=Rhinatrema bivittatum TaxID=194408 RepID=UPI00112BD1EF|nr:cytochrome P450 2K6-like isoform X1 [Rhinatrema bivittatum]
MIFWSSVIIILLFLLIFIISKHVTESRTPQNFPPGPRPLPFIGSLHMLDLKRPHKTFVELSKKYGSVFSIQLGMKKMVVLTGYETVKEALVNHGDTFGDRARVPLFDQIYKGLGIIFSYGENWKAMRRFSITTLRDFGMGKRTIEDKIIEECGSLIQHYESFNGNPFNTAVIMNASVANIIVAILLGHRYDYEDPTFLRLVNLISETLRLQGSPIATLYSIYPKLGFLPGSHKNIFENVKELHSFIKSIFIKHLKHLDENDQRSFIDVFLVKKEEEKANPNSYFHDDNLTSVVRNLFIAGTETTSTTLNWALLLMMKYPEIQEKVQKEIERVIGSSQPRIDHRKQMPYTDAVIHEIQRFADIVPMNLPRETTTDTYFKGYFLPKGTYIVPLLTSVLKDKSQFEKPEDFNPQHFLDSAGNFVKKDAFMPFSAGRRVCMGETLAKMELFLFFTSLLQKFIFRPPPGVTHFDLTPAVGTTTPPMPYLLCALPRS